MTHFGADVTLLPSEAKPNFSTLAKVDICKFKSYCYCPEKMFATWTPSCDVHHPVLKKAFAKDNFLPYKLLPE